jgi:hypothetical protein
MQLAVRPFIADSMPETADRLCRLRNGHSGVSRPNPEGRIAKLCAARAVIRDLL